MPHHRLRALITAAPAAVILGFALTLPADASVGVTINGNSVDVEPPPITQAGRVFVPLRGVFEQLGASVVYDDGHINATGNGRTIALNIGSTQATVDGQPQTIDVAPFIVGASTYVPLRFISESLGASVNWDDAEDIVQISLAGGSQAQPPDMQMDTDAVDESDAPPPPLPDYQQPPVPEPNDIWQPGYWANGTDGYYWVPGTWVQPPQPGYLWTPGYWAYAGNRYGFHPGYWALTVGFYGGVNYGFGYFGHGYDGGRWSHDTFQYNTSVTHVNTTVVHNVYVDRTVVVNAPAGRPSYNGGPRGVQAAPTAGQLAVARGHHVGMTPAQHAHVEAAAHDPRLLASENHDQPPVLAVARPLTPQRPAEASADHAPAAAPAYHAPAAPDRAPAEHAAPDDRAPAYHAPAAAPAYHAPAPADRAPAEHAAPAYRAQAAAPAYHAPAPADRAPAEHAAPAYHAPAAAPAYHAPAPADRAPAEHAAPAYHAAPPAARPAPQEHSRPPEPEHKAPPQHDDDHRPQ